MAIFYVDLVDGDDANNGSTWALAKKTTGSAGLAAAIGDEIRVAKSPNPVSLGNGTWTNASEIIALATARNQTLYKQDAWTAAADVTSDTNTIHKIGTNNARITAGAGFTSGKMAYFDLGSNQDLSAYTKVSLWVRASNTITSGILTLELCSDANGDTPVNSLSGIQIPFINRWTVFTLDNGAALGSAIRTIALYATASIGTQQIQLDCVITCESSGPNLESLFTKGSTIGDGHGLYAPMYIDGTEVRIGYGTNVNLFSPTFTRGYAGTTETVTTYMVQPISRPLLNGTTALDCSINQTGTDSGGTIVRTKFIGGWNVDDTTRDGYTVIGGRNGVGRGVGGSSILSEASYFVCVRYTDGTNFNNASQVSLHDCIAVGCTTNGHYLSAKNAEYYNLAVYGHGELISSGAIQLQNADYSIARDFVVETSSGIGLLLTGSMPGLVVKNHIARRCNGGIAVQTVTAGRAVIVRPEVYNSNYAIVGTGGSTIFGTTYIYIVRPTFTSNDALTSTLQSNGLSAIHMQDYPSAGLHTIVIDNGTIEYQTTEFYTGASGSWAIGPTNSARGIAGPIRLPLIKHFCTSGAAVSIKVWVKKSHATNVGAVIRVLEHAHSSITTTVEATAANNTDWQQLELSFTCSHDEVVSVEAIAYHRAGSAIAYFSGPIEIVSTPPFNIDTFGEVNLAEDISLV